MSLTLILHCIVGKKYEGGFGVFVFLPVFLGVKSEKKGLVFLLIQKTRIFIV